MRSTIIILSIAAALILPSVAARSQELTPREYSVMNCARYAEGISATYIAILAGQDDETIKSRIPYTDKTASEVSAVLASMRAEIGKEKPKNEWELMRIAGREFQVCLGQRGIQVASEKTVTCFRFARVLRALLRSSSASKSESQEVSKALAKLDPALPSLVEAAMGKAPALEDDQWFFEIQETSACLGTN